MLSFQILNVALNETGDREIRNVFIIKEDNLLTVNPPYWFGSGFRQPFEDFCTLDGIGCPAKPVDVIAVSVSTGVAIIFLVTVAIIIYFLVKLRRAKQDAKRREMAKLVLIDFNDLEFSREDRRAIERIYGSMRKHSRYTSRSGSISSRMTTNNENNVSPTFRILFRGEHAMAKRMVHQFIRPTHKLVKELTTLRDLHHHNIGAFLGVTCEGNRVFSVQQWCSKGTLKSVLAQQELNLDRTFKRAFVSDIASGISYLHHSRLHSHGLMNSENIVIDSRWVCKITSMPIAALEHEIDESVIGKLSRRRNSGSSMLSGFSFMRRDSNGSTMGKLSFISNLGNLGFGKQRLQEEGDHDDLGVLLDSSRTAADP